MSHEYNDKTIDHITSRVSPQTSSGSTILYGAAIRLDFDPKGHTYTVTDLSTLTVREVPSVTQILGVIGGSKVWGLKQWAANLASDYIRDAIRPGMSYDELQIEQIIERARKNFHTVSRGAKTIGQLAHEWIEAHLRARLYATPELPLPVNEQTRKAIQAASTWIAKHFKPVSMEHRLYSREHDYAGTLDVVGEVDGQLAVVDWKTSKAIYDEMPLQAAAYAQAWSEMNDERVPDRWVIRLDKETGEFEPVKFPRETFRRDLRGFLAAKALHLTLNAMTTPRPPRPAKTALASPPAAILPQTQREPTNVRPAAPAFRRQSLDHKPHQRSISYLKAGAALSHLKTHILPKLGECALTELNTLCLQKFVTAIAAEGKSTKTITNVLHTLTSILNSARVFGIARGEFSRSDLKLPRRETKRGIRSNTTEERAKIIFYAKEPYATMFCVFSIEALRSGEVLALKVTDLDFATKVFHIRHSLDSRTRKVKVTKTDASAKDLPMTPKLEERLLRFLQTWRSNPEGFLFTNQNGRPFSLGKVVEYGLWPAQDAAGIRRSGLHAFRHGVNSDLLDKGAPPAVTQRHLRHANMKTNLGFYSHVVGDAHRKAVEGLEERTEQFIRQLESGT